MSSRILAGRYELLEKMGEGGMAVVFKSRDRLLNRYVAIKILRPEFTKDAAFVESFRRESQMAAGLSHPNIVSVYDVGKEGNIYYIVMELMTGESLSEVIKKEGALEPHRAAVITRQIASALSAAHKNHLIHRDVKPHNIMFALDGTAKITDFGIAKVVSGETLVGEQKENVMGSVHYFSPEQASGGHVDEKSDIYSLGICLFEMLTGTVPFDGETAVEVAVKHINEPMPTPQSVKPDIPDDLNDIVMKATDKHPGNRFKSMDDMITALNFVSYTKHHGTENKEEIKETETPAEESDSKRFFGEDDFLFSKESSGVSVAASAADAADETPKDKKDPFAAIKKYQAKKKLKEETIIPVGSERKKVFFHPQRYVAVLLAILLAIPVSSLISNAMNREKQPPAPVEVNVPSVINMTTEEAETALAEYGLKLAVDMELISSEFEPGHIISQTPQAEAVVKSGQTVKVNVSRGTVSASVPNVAGKSYANAKAVLEIYGYKVAVSAQKADSVIEKGYVISQSPKPGIQLEEGKTVSLVLSTGNPNGGSSTTAEFNLVGVELEAAKAQLEEWGLRLGTISYKTSTSIPEGAIISHNPAAGKMPAKGTSVDLIVSTGNTSQGGTGNQSGESGELKIDNTVQIPVSFNKVPEETSAFTLKITIADSNGSRTYTEECVREDGSKTVSISGAGQGAKVYIFFDSTMAYNFTIDFTTGTVEGGEVI